MRVSSLCRYLSYEISGLGLRSDDLEKIEGVLPEYIEILQAIEFPLPKLEHVHVNEYRNARVAAHHLLKNVTDKPSNWDRRVMKWMKTDQQAELKIWLEAIEKIKKLRSKLSDEIIHEMLIAAYKKMGFS